MDFLHTPTLLAVTAGFNAFALLIWLLLGLVFKLSPRACQFMAAAHGLRILGPAIGDWLGLAALSEAAVDLLSLASVVLLGMAVRRMAREQPDQHLPVVLGLVSGAAVSLACFWGALDAALGLTCAGTAALTLVSAADMRRAFMPLRKPWVSAGLMSPFIAVALLGLFRSVARLGDPSMEAALMQGRVPTPLLALLWWVLTCAVTVTLLALLVWRMVARIQYLLRRDGLTHVLNRRAFQQQLVQAQALLQRGRGFALVMLDIDHFKRVNDSLGHAAGDAALRHCVQVWRSCLREVDQIGRLGGEEFAVLLPGASLAEASAVAERMRQALEATPLRWQNQKLALSASFGVAPPQPFDFDGQAGLARADAQLYRAKAQGRNRVCTAPELAT